MPHDATPHDRRALVTGATGTIGSAVARDAAALFRLAETVLGRVDILVNCTGAYHRGSLLETGEEQWQELIDVDLHGTRRLIQHAAPAMVQRGSGRVVNVSSVAGQRYGEGEGAYGTVKAAVEMLTRAWAVELAPHGVTVNAVAPGLVWSAGEAGVDAASSPPACGDVPDRRPADAAEVASLVRYLISDEAGHVTGQVVNIDGGLTARLPRPR